MKERRVVVGFKYMFFSTGKKHGHIICMQTYMCLWEVIHKFFRGYITVMEMSVVVLPTKCSMGKLVTIYHWIIYSSF